MPASSRAASTVALDGHGERLDKLLVAHAGEFSRSHLQGLIERGCVRVDDASRRSASRRVRAGQAVERRVRSRPPRASLHARVDGRWRSGYEDEHLLVWPSPPDWSCTRRRGTGRHPAQRPAGSSPRRHAGLPRAGIVHRLDKDTSGLMVVAKTLPAMTALVRAIAAREVQARVPGPGPRRRRCDAVRRSRLRSVATRFARAHGSRGRRQTGADRRLRASACRAGFAALRCTPAHRAHAPDPRASVASRGHPLVADTLYGGAQALGLQRQALHARPTGLEAPARRPPMALRGACRPPTWRGLGPCRG